MEEREKYAKEIKSFTENTKNELSSILSEFGWTLPSNSANLENFVICPFNSAHRVLMRSLEKHIEACQWKAEGYNEFDIPFSHSKSNTSSSITIDEELQNQILMSAKQQDPTLNIGDGGQLIPRTANRLFSDFTNDERRVLYNFVVSNTAKPDLGHDITDLNNPKFEEGKSNAMSKQDLLALERDMKRRRVKHKGVHTNKRSQTEILREVINQQMEMFSEYLQEQKVDESSVRERRSDNENRKKYEMQESESKELLKKKRGYDESLSRSDYSRSRHRSGERSKHRGRSRSKSHKKSHKKEKHRSKEKRNSSRESSHRHKSKKSKHKRRSRSRNGG